ncbi:caudovirus prohead protease [Clostridium magnum DSM 2767]|uniref:Caudovirus prohead protease n=2 Tax=Clostridium magnum TaxID=33954 RepID=A0A161Y5M7_9CLOT|nr:caudovirus prohead protease [Clostridium magnum DSM 2767]SHI61033.1 prohead peptidase. Unknown type peptidase. MEROPS family U35 [Clostridium magnum DSM 2767]
MRIEIRNDSVLLDGYVNAVGRDSKPIITAKGKMVEQIEPRAFDRALERADNVDLLLNHGKELGSFKYGNLQLFEDNIGLRAICTVTDSEVMQKAKDGKLKGWSFGMYVNKDRIEERAGDIPRRIVSDLDLFEVSIIDDRMSPCYVGTSIEQRADQEVISEQRGDEFRAVVVDETTKTPIDYSEFEKRIQKVKERKED